MKQPDLGTSLTYAAIVGAGIFFAGLRWQHALASGLVILLVLPVGLDIAEGLSEGPADVLSGPGQRSAGVRLPGHPVEDCGGHPAACGERASRAGSQTQLRFLPVAHTDFILSAFAEEHGFVGVVVVLGLYFLMLMQIVQNAQAAPDRAGMYICMGICALLLFHVLVNVGMLVGRMPVTGVPLPLMSYGGSSVLTVFMMLGLVNNVRLQRFVN